MERVISVAPDSVRVWRGYAITDLAKDQFFQKLGNVFIPITAQHQAPAGLTAYLPTVLPPNKPECLPDEIALVFYASQADYKQTFKTCGGRAYGLLHSAVFDGARSKSGFPELLIGSPQPNHPYYLLNQPADWYIGRSRVLVGTRRAADSPEYFKTIVTEMLNSVQQKAVGLDGLYFVYTEDYLTCWEHQPCVKPLPHPTLIDELASLVTVILQEYDRPHSISYGPYTEHQGLTVQGGEHFNIRFERQYERRVMREKNLPVYGLHGNPHAAPADTMAGYWAALGAGAAGIVAAVQLSADGIPICAPDNRITDSENSPFPISDHTAKECARINAGATFRSVILDQNNQTDGRFGSDTPWKSASLIQPRLQEVLQVFGRRTEIMLLVTESADPARLALLVGKILEMLKSFGLEEHVTLIGDKQVCLYCRESPTETPFAYILSAGETIQNAMETARRAGIKSFYLSLEDIKTVDLEQIRANGCTFLLTCKGFSLSPFEYREIGGQEGLRGLVMRGVDRTVQLVTPPALVMADDFSGNVIDLDLWTCGYSHCNRDTVLSQNDGLTIAIAEGGEYSGAAAVSRIPVHGDFDAQVDFYVESPQQATTFELAAITIDPGYHHPQNDDLNSRNVNLTFDVHGAPPYASSERDEDNGFRIGWNNSHNLTRIDTEWQSDSGNMYNKYGPDVGDGTQDNLSGTLRLTRHGTVFNSYYKDKYNAEWVCSGSALVHNMADEVFLRLAAKHWRKGGIPPSNKVRFSKFRLHQF